MRRDDDGMVTLELAAASVLTAGAMGLVGWFLLTLLLFDQCQITANEVARQAARGDAGAVAKASSDAPRGAQVSVARAGGATTVSVRVPAPPPFAAIVPVAAEATVLDEARP